MQAGQMNAHGLATSNREASLNYLRQRQALSNSLNATATQAPNGAQAFVPPAQSRDATVRSAYFQGGNMAANILVPASPPVAQNLVYKPHQSHYSQQTQQPWATASMFATDLGSTSSLGSFPPATPQLQGFSTHPDLLPPSDLSSTPNILAPPPNLPTSSADILAPPPNLAGASLPTYLPPSPSTSRKRIPDLSLYTAPAKRQNIGHRPQHIHPHIMQQMQQQQQLAIARGMQINTMANVRVNNSSFFTDAQTAPHAVAKTFATTHGHSHPHMNGAQFIMYNGVHSQVSSQFGSPAPSPSPTRTAQTRAQAQAAAQRAAAKEKSKASAIYAKRTELRSGRDDSDYETDEEAGPTPAVVTRATRPKKPRVVDSEDEDDFDPDGVGGGFGSANLPAASEETLVGRALDIFNTMDESALVELLSCSPEQAQLIVQLRPYEDEDDFEAKLRSVLQRGRGRGASIAGRMFEECTELVRGYFAVDALLDSCERTGAQLRSVLEEWAKFDRSRAATPDEERDSGAHIVAFMQEKLDANDTAARRIAFKDYISKPPEPLTETLRLKDYQLLGLNWLNLLHSKGLSCILADEMGLGKTIQVISFLAHLKEKGNHGPHLIVVPSSTLENWVREFDRFAPTIKVQTYYGTQKDRMELRSTLVDKNAKPHGWEVLVTTYNLAQSSDQDRKFLRRIDWETCVFDEGHVLKNFQSQRYTHLMKIDSKWRLLLTGTPLQNNLQELVSLMNFILPDYFESIIGSLRAIFKVKSDAQQNMLSQQRIQRAKRMMTPFVLRRRKDQVLKDLPKKTERIEWCEMNSEQSVLYRDVLQRSKKTLLEAPAEGEQAPKKRGRPPKNKEKLPSDLSTNVLMDLRKASSHPMLFRRAFDDGTLARMAKACKRDGQWKDSNVDLIKEDLSVMTDSELQHFCNTHDCLKKFAQKDEIYLGSGKVQTLLKIIIDSKEHERRVLVFSQFTQVLDILQAVLDLKSIKFLLLTGQTAVDTRQGLVDEFTEDTTIDVFLLSTKAGGMGINLTAASVVVLFDQDFNPHNDRQAADRAYRIGQLNTVDVIKLISKGTIEEDILRLGETKIALDEAVAGEAFDGEEEASESRAEKIMKASLLEVLKQQLDDRPSVTSTDLPTPVDAQAVEPKIEDASEPPTIMVTEASSDVKT